MLIPEPPAEAPLPVILERHGECNLCGQCCGAEDGPYPASPWPKDWHIALRNWQYEDILRVWPQAILFGLVKKELLGENVGPVKVAGYVRLHGRQFHWIYVEGEGICKQLPPYGVHGGVPHYWLECPLLDGQPGDKVRPCALFGTDFEWMWRRTCQHFPRERETEAVVREWCKAHPLCSYTWDKVR